MSVESKERRFLSEPQNTFFIEVRLETMYCIKDGHRCCNIVKSLIMTIFDEPEITIFGQASAELLAHKFLS